MQRISLKDKALFERYFSRYPAHLSMYSFAGIFVWDKLFAIYRRIIDGNLCVFFENGSGCFMPLEPLGDLSEKSIKRAFDVMERINKNSPAARIENISQDHRGFYENLGFKLRPHDSEYLYALKDLIELSGNDFKSKRSSYNFFVKHYNYVLEELSPEISRDCLKLYKDWAKNRANKFEDKIYQGCLEDSRVTQEEAFKYFKCLNFLGRVVKVDGEVKGYSFGFKLNKDTFYIMFETTDLNIKGLSQFLFRSFCQNLAGFKFINAGCDSGFSNLARVKQSYRPAQVLKTFIAERQ